MIIAIGLAMLTYVNSFSLRQGHSVQPAYRELAAGGATGNIIYDWFIGCELNPLVRFPGLGHVDLKTFMETRPGLMGWLILDLAFLVKQYRDYGFVSSSMVLVILSQGMYIFDSFWNEPGITTQIDIVMDGFGFMLAFGDLVWVPFIFSLQARYLSVYPHDLGIWSIVSVVAVQIAGYYIFRASNDQKDTFRRNPDHPSVKRLSYIQTKTGSKLLTSAWWGAARHINYLGDWLLSWAYCLPTGVAGYIVRRSSQLPAAVHSGAGHKSLTGDREVIPRQAYGWGMLVTYFYLIYFAVLLIHRQRRDDEKCHRKYGKD